MRIKRIMLATDFSPSAHAALRYAAELSQRLDVPLLLASSFPPGMYPLPEGAIMPSPESIADGIVAITRALDDEKRAAVELGAVSVETTVLQGLASTELVRCAADRMIDLIVMGTHGRSGLGRALLGSIADKVVRTAPCPVVVVRDDVPAS